MNIITPETMMLAQRKQEKIDKVLCKAGYTYSPAQKRCIPFAAPPLEEPNNKIPKEAGETAEGAVRVESAKRSGGKSK